MSFLGWFKKHDIVADVMQTVETLFTGKEGYVFQMALNFISAAAGMDNLTGAQKMALVKNKVDELLPGMLGEGVDTLLQILYQHYASKIAPSAVAPVPVAPAPSPEPPAIEEVVADHSDQITQLQAQISALTAASASAPAPVAPVTPQVQVSVPPTVTAVPPQAVVTAPPVQ